jgi:hypothetical protein
MLKRMSSRTLTEWMAYSQLEPFGDELLDAHFAQLTAMVELLRRPKATRLEPKRFRLWKQDSEAWDPQAFFDGLKGAIQFLNKDKK